MSGPSDPPSQSPASPPRQRSSVVFFNDACTHVLLVTSSSRPGCWVLPGGGVEAGETPAVCAARELWEEAGAAPLALSAGGLLLLQLSQAPLPCKRSLTHPFATRLGSLAEAYPECSQRQRKWWPLAEVQAALAGSAVGETVWGCALQALGCTAAGLTDTEACAKGILALLIPS